METKEIKGVDEYGNPVTEIYERESWDQPFVLSETKKGWDKVSHPLTSLKGEKYRIVKFGPEGLIRKYSGYLPGKRGPFIDGGVVWYTGIPADHNLNGKNSKVLGKRVWWWDV